MARNHRTRALLRPVLLPALLAACLRGDAGGPRGAGVSAPLADASGPAPIDPATSTARGDPDERDAEASADTSAPAATTINGPTVPTDAADPDPSDSATDPANSPPRQHHLPDLLGARRARVVDRTGEPGVDAEAGWVHHGPDLTLRYEDGRAVELLARVPALLECSEAARWLGFTAAMPPLRRSDRCLWPGVSDRHRLAPGLAGELVLATATFHVWKQR